MAHECERDHRQGGEIEAEHACQRCTEHDSDRAYADPHEPDPRRPSIAVEEVHQPEHERHRREGGQIVLAHERPLPLAAVGYELDCAPGNGNGAEGDEKGGKLAEPPARVDERGGGEREDGEVGQLPGGSDRTGRVRDRAEDDQHRKRSDRAQQPRRRNPPAEPELPDREHGGDEQRRIGRADGECRSTDVDVKAR